MKEEPALAGLKEEAGTVQEEEMVLEGEKEANTADTVEFFETGADNKNGCHEEESRKKPWMRVKDGGVKKISGEERRRKRNIRMKKLLTPKVKRDKGLLTLTLSTVQAPTMILHELLLTDGQGSPSYEVEAVQVVS